MERVTSQSAPHSMPSAAGSSLPDPQPPASTETPRASEKSGIDQGVVKRVTPATAFKASPTGVLAKPKKWTKQFIKTAKREAEMTEAMHDFRSEAWKNRADTRHDNITDALRRSGKPLANFRANVRDVRHDVGSDLREVGAAFYGLGGIFTGLTRGVFKAARETTPSTVKLMRPKTLLDAGHVDSAEQAVAVWSLLHQRGLINRAGDVYHGVASWSREEMADDLKRFTTILEYVGPGQLDAVLDFLKSKRNYTGHDLSLAQRSKAGRLEYLFDNGLVASRAESERVTRMLRAAGVLTKDYLPDREGRFDRKTEQLFEHGSPAYRTRFDTNLTAIREALFGPPAYRDRLGDVLIGQGPVAPSDDVTILQHVLATADRVSAEPGPVPAEPPPGYVDVPAYSPRKLGDGD